MAIDKITLARSLLTLRHVLRDSADAALAQAQGVAGIDEELRALLRPYAMAYQEAVQPVLALLAADAKAVTPTAEEKAAYVDAELQKASGEPVAETKR